MSDITVQNGHEEIASDSFGPSELVQTLRFENQRLTEILEEREARASERIQALKDSHQEQLDRMARGSRVRDSQRAIADMALAHLRQQAMRQMATIGDVDQATEEDGYYLRTVERAFQIGRVLGYTSECRTLAHELDLVELWEKVRDDSTYDILDDAERYSKINWIVGQARMYPDSERHPMSAEYRDLWKKAFRISKQVGLCDEYSRIAGYIGVPTDFDMPWTGTVRVYVEGYFDIDVEGNASDGEPDAYEAMNSVDLRDYVSDMEFTAEFTEINYED